MIIRNIYRFSNPLCWSINQSTGYLFLFFSFLPWVNFGLNARDSQPWALLFGLIFLLTSFKKTFKKKDLLILLLPLIAMIVWLFFSTNILDFVALRALISYFTITVCLFGFLVYLRRYDFPIALVVVINVVYLAVGIAQLYFPDVVSAIVVSRGLGETGRGVTSLTPEPTFFGLFLFFISFVFLVHTKFQSNHKINLLILINILAILFLSKSSTVVVFLLLSTPLVIITRMSFRYVLPLSLFIFLLALSAFFFLQDSRIMLIYDLVAEQGIAQLIYIDASVNDRVANILYPLHGFYLNNFLPSGFHSFTDTHTYLNKYYGGFFNYGSGSTSILSYFGAFVYELGFLGLLFLMWLFIRIQDGSFSRFIDASLFFILLNSSIPPLFPLIPLIFALFIVNNKKLEPIQQ